MIEFHPDQEYVDLHNLTFEGLSFSKKNKRISIIIPKIINVCPKSFYNCKSKNEKIWIIKCLNEIYNQNYKNIEVILVDNNTQMERLK